MIRRLHRRFILISMAMVGVVLLVSMCLLVAFSFRANQANVSQALEIAFTMETASPPVLNVDRLVPSQEENAIPKRSQQSTVLPTFTVTLNQTSGEVLSVSGTDGDSEDSLVQQAAAEAFASGPKGVLRSLSLRYESRALENGTVRYAFVDISSVLQSNRRMLLSCGIIFLGGMGLMLLVCWLLSRLALRPVQTAWDQQRQFVADASHELKTPLTVILANINILASHPTATIQSQKKWVDYIQSEAQRMKALVESLLFLARSDQAQVALPMETVNLSDCLWECLLPFESVAFEAGIALETQVEDGRSLSGNEAQLKQLIMILLDNACKYTPKGGTIHVTLRQQEESLRLTVNNLGGEPIPPEALPHLFERFYRTDASRSREAGGYGLGLSIAQTIVQTHNGRITVSSTEECGTTFTVTLPKK